MMTKIQPDSWPQEFREQKEWTPREVEEIERQKEEQRKREGSDPDQTGNES